MIDDSALTDTGIWMMTVEDGNRHFRFSEDFQFDIEVISVIRYCGCDSQIRLNRHIEILCPDCFSSSTAI
jgi:hypothetical protein